jgi:hypothetical protein
MIVLTPSDSIPLRIHIHGQGAARPYRKQDNQPSTYLFPLKYQPLSPSSMKDVMA